MKPRRLLALGAALAAWLAVAVPAGAASAEDEVAPASIVPRYLLRGPNGGAVTDGDFRGRFQLLAFGYTFCPDVCPTTLMEMAQILKRLGGEAERLQALFVTVDPERDTAEVLKTYTAFFDKRIVGLGGSPELVRRVAENFKVRYEFVREPGAAPGQYTVDHSAGMFLLGPDGGFVAKFGYGARIDDMVARIRSEMAAFPPERR